MSGINLAAEAGEKVSLTGGNLTLVVVVALVAVLALAVAGYLVREVLAADEGTEKMKEIAGAVQEGAAAYLTRQFRTLAVFAAIALPPFALALHASSAAPSNASPFTAKAVSVPALRATS